MLAFKTRLFITRTKRKKSYELSFEKGWAGIPLHIYNLSKKISDQILDAVIDSYENEGSGIAFKLKGLVYKADIRCLELDAFVTRYRKFFRNNLDLQTVDEYPPIGYHEVLFEKDNPFEEANRIRKILRKFKIDYDTFEVLTTYYDGVVKSRAVIDDKSREFAVLSAQGLAVPVIDLSPEQALLHFFRLETIRRVVKELGLNVTARSKRELLEKLKEKTDLEKIFKKAMEMEPYEGYYIKPIEELSQDDLNWFVNFVLSVEHLIFWTLEKKVSNTFLFYKSSNRLTVRSPNNCCRKCKDNDGKVISDVRDIPPYHLGCECRVEEVRG